MRLEKERRAEQRRKEADPNFDLDAARWPMNATSAPFAPVPDELPAAGWYDALKAKSGSLTARGIGETATRSEKHAPRLPVRAASARRRRPHVGRQKFVYKGLTPPLT
jgi:hypothetical protein